jgi:uncharacterized protein (UPF0147 family)
MLDPVTIGLLSTALSAGYKGIQGGIQQRQANQALKALEGQEPDIYVPSAIRQRAQEPIAREFMSAQEESEARRTAQSVGALQKAGSRGIIGGLGGVMDAERASERNRMAGYEQERRGALGDLGRAEMDVQNRQMANYLSKIQAATRAKEAGQQNIAGALDTVSNAGQQYMSADLMGLLPKNFGKAKKTIMGSTRPKLSLSGLYEIDEEMEQGVPLD